MAHQSTLITGVVMHQRTRPILHRFIYPVFMVRINLDQLCKDATQLNSYIFGINTWRPLSLYFKDYGPRNGSDLRTWINGVLQHNDIEVDGEIHLQTFPRVFGYAFNPINLWYCHNKKDELIAVLAEVNNTFGEQHLYLLRNSNQKTITSNSILSSKKSMHVSPFCEVKGHYEFQFFESTKNTRVKINYYDEIEVLIYTAIIGKKHTFNTSALSLALLKQPFLTLGVIFRIHWQALRLLIKRVPFRRQPIASNTTITLGTLKREGQEK